MPTIVSVVLVTFTWFLVYPTALAAQTLARPQHTPRPPASPPSEEAEFPALLAQIEATLNRLQEQLGAGEDGGLDPAELTHFRQRLAHLDTRARQQFAQLAQHLQANNLPAEIHQRHREAVATYETAVATLRQQPQDLAAATTPQTRQAKAAQVVQHLRASQPPRTKRAFDPNRLPFRTPNGHVRKARETKKSIKQP